MGGIASFSGQAKVTLRHSAMRAHALLILLYILSWMVEAEAQTQTQTAKGEDGWKKMNNFRIIDDCGGRMKEMIWGRCKTDQRRTTNGIVQYNAGWMHSGRTNHISSVYAQKIITIQGTKQTNVQDVTLQ